MYVNKNTNPMYFNENDVCNHSFVIYCYRAFQFNQVMKQKKLKFIK